MQIIEGVNVDLIAPFPLREVKRAFGWNHCYRTLTESDDSPKGMEDFLSLLTSQLSQVASWGIVDKNQITNSKHEAPLVGIISFEPQPPVWGLNVRNGFFHVATARKAFRTGLVDEAGQLVLRELFEKVPTLLRVSAYMLEKNFPAKALCKRLGFNYEGVVHDGVQQNGEPQNMVLYGLTRRNYLCQNSSEDCLVQTPLPQLPINQEPPTPQDQQPNPPQE